MGEPARQLRVGRMRFPGRPAAMGSHDRRRLSLLLGEGVLCAQMVPAGRRAVFLPDQRYASPSGLYTPTGKPVLRGPHSRTMVQSAWPLEVVLGAKGALQVVDVMVPRVLDEREAIARTQGFDLELHRLAYVEDLAAVVERARELGCPRVVVKDARVPYPWLPWSGRTVRNWWYVLTEEM